MTAQRHDRHVATEQVLAAFEPLHRWRMTTVSRGARNRFPIAVAINYNPPGAIRESGGRQQMKTI